MKLQLANKWALVTGASSGIGEEFANQLAARGMHLILTARREEKLNQLAEKLSKQHGTKTVVIACDLSKPEAVGELIVELRKLSQSISLLINNAGFGNISTIKCCDPARLQDLVQVNITVVTRLIYEFLPEMVARNEGGIINVASVASFQAVPYMGVYSASKAYVLHLSEALWAELIDTNVRMLALCPGTTKTEFFDEAGANGWLNKTSAHTPQQVVKKAIKFYEKNRSLCLPGIKNNLIAFFAQITRRNRVLMISKNIFRKSAEDAEKKNRSPSK